MKKLLTVVLFASFLFSNSATAQFSLGGGLVYGADLKDLGFQLKLSAGITERIRVGGDFIKFFDGTDGLSISEFNINGHYILSDDDVLRLYGLAGLNLLTINVLDLAKETGAALNLGGGAEYYISDSLAISAEVKQSIGETNQFLIAAGVIYTFGL